MRPTDILKTEHDAIQTMLKITETVCSKLESQEPVNPEHLKQIVEFIQVFADRCHHGKEEDLLFKALEAVGVPKEGGPIGVMLMEHDMGRRYVKKMSEAATAYGKGSREAAKQFIDNARNYVILLSQHIFKENNVLFPLADRLLPEETQDKLVEQFEVVEREKIGAGQHEQLHKLLDELKKIYWR